MGTQGMADESCEIIEEKNATLLPQSATIAANQKPSIEPTTPANKRESGEQIHKPSSPEVLVSTPPSDLCSDSYLSNGFTSPTQDDSLTPKERVFDPFAPGPDKFMLAPLRKRYTDESRTSAARRLNFSSATKLVWGDNYSESGLEATSGENELFEKLYYSILDAVVSEQTKEHVADVSDSDGFATPKSAPHMSWIAETCPEAPVKLSSKNRNIDKELCRKLEF